MTTALTATCPTCGATQGKICRDGRTPTTPHSARRDAHNALRAGSASVYFVVRDDGPLRRGDLIVGAPPHVGSPGVKVQHLLSDHRPVAGVVRASAVVWVGWETDFNPALFDPTEALEAFPA
ncbi:zinc finger domain-containing protein [Curtobacterium citreum]